MLSSTEVVSHIPATAKNRKRSRRITVTVQHSVSVIRPDGRRKSGVEAIDTIHGSNDAGSLTNGVAKFALGPSSQFREDQPKSSSTSQLYSTSSISSVDAHNFEIMQNFRKNTVPPPAPAGDTIQEKKRSNRRVSVFVDHSLDVNRSQPKLKSGNIEINAESSTARASFPGETQARNKKSSTNYEYFASAEVPLQDENVNNTPAQSPVRFTVLFLNRIALVTPKTTIGKSGHSSTRGHLAFTPAFRSSQRMLALPPDADAFSSSDSRLADESSFRYFSYESPKTSAVADFEMKGGKMRVTVVDERSMIVDKTTEELKRMQMSFRLGSEKNTSERTIEEDYHELAPPEVHLTNNIGQIQDAEVIEERRKGVNQEENDALSFRDDQEILNQEENDALSLRDDQEIGLSLEYLAFSLSEVERRLKSLPERNI